jgi:hypothetical protein
MLKSVASRAEQPDPNCNSKEMGLFSMSHFEQITLNPEVTHETFCMARFVERAEFLRMHKIG